MSLSIQKTDIRGQKSEIDLWSLVVRVCLLLLGLTSDLRPLTSDFEGQKKDETGGTPGSEAAAA